MSIMFQYRESRMGDDMLCIKTNQHLEIEVLFENGEATHIYVDENEFKVIEDTLYGLFVGIGDQVMSLVEIIREADRQYPAIMEEIEQEDRDAAEMERELSCPRRTGRI